MHSPKFPGKAADLRKTIDATHLRKLWVSSVRDHMRRQILPDPVEFLDFHIHVTQRCREIQNGICAGEYVPSRVIRLKSEKSKGLCRQLVLPTPIDALILQALSNSLWSTIRSKAPSTNAFYAPQDQPFSKKNKATEEDPVGYGPFSAWLDFQKEILGFSSRHKYVVVTDIANYYDSIIHGFLRAILADYTAEKEHVLDLLLYVLDSMLWRPDYMPNYGIGLPQMNLDAPRLLAHTKLFEIDALFSKDDTISFARFMDDMDFGVDSVAKAKQVLMELDLALQTRNVRLNSGKTKIMTAKEARLHFRVANNERVDRLEDLLDDFKVSLARRSIRIKALSKMIVRGTLTGYFNTGNGDKILKRLISVATKHGISLDDSVFTFILFDKPDLRDTALKNRSSIGFEPHHIKICADFLRSGEAVDDVSQLLVSSYIVAGRFVSFLPSADIDYLVDSFDKNNHISLYCRLWIISRFRSTPELKYEIDNSSVTWSRHRHLIRLVAGIYGLFKPTLHFASFEAFVRKWGGTEASGMLEFHGGLATDATAFLSVAKFLKSPNTSLPNAISHAKTLMLATMFLNTAIPKIDRAKLLAKSAKTMGDVYYQSTFSAIMTAAP